MSYSSGLGATPFWSNIAAYIRAATRRPHGARQATPSHFQSGPTVSQAPVSAAKLAAIAQARARAAAPLVAIARPQGSTAWTPKDAQTWTLIVVPTIASAKEATGVTKDPAVQTQIVGGMSVPSDTGIRNLGAIAQGRLGWSVLKVKFPLIDEVLRLQSAHVNIADPAWVAEIRRAAEYVVEGELHGIGAMEMPVLDWKQIGVGLFVGVGLGYVFFAKK